MLLLWIFLMPLLYHKTVYYVLALLVYYVPTLYITNRPHPNEIPRRFGGRPKVAPTVKLCRVPSPERNAALFRRRAYASLREAIRKRMRGTAKRWKEPARRKIKGFFIVTHSPPPACGGSPLPEGASRQGSAAPITSARVDTITVGAIHVSRVTL